MSKSIMNMNNARGSGDGKGKCMTWRCVTVTRSVGHPEGQYKHWPKILICTFHNICSKHKYGHFLIATVFSTLKFRFRWILQEMIIFETGIFRTRKDS